MTTTILKAVDTALNVTYKGFKKLFWFTLGVAAVAGGTAALIIIVVADVLH